MAWFVGGLATDGYSPIDDAISQIAAVGAPIRVLMTVGFVLFGSGMALGSIALRGSAMRRCWPLAAVNAVAAFAVAFTPLESSTIVDSLHGASAAVGYVSLAAMPLLAAPVLRGMGRPRHAAISSVIGIVSALCLVSTLVVEANGLFQRLGLGVVDVWLIALGIQMYRSRLDLPPS